MIKVIHGDYNNLPTGEFYDIELDYKKPYNIYGGTQDDTGPAKEWRNEFNDPWKYLWIDAWDGGDGCITELILMIAVYYILVCKMSN